MWTFQVQAPTEYYLSEYAIIGNNSFQAVSAPYLPYTRVYGALITPQSEKIIECESQWDENAKGKAGEIGLAQFLPKTFYWMSELSGIKGSIYDPITQIELLNWALDNGYESHWTCWKIINSNN